MTPVAGYLYVSADKVFAAQLDYLQLRHFQNSQAVRPSAANLSEM